MSMSNKLGCGQNLADKALLGIIGGLSYHSTVIYYEKINQSFAQQFGPGRSAPLLLYSHDFGMVMAAQEAGDWQQVKTTILDSANILAAAACQALLIASNTIHKLSPQI